MTILEMRYKKIDELKMLIKRMNEFSKTETANLPSIVEGIANQVKKLCIELSLLEKMQTELPAEH